MCGIIVTKKDCNDFFIKRRGQDFKSVLERDGYEFRHYLLHITGERTPQPFVDGNIVCLYNGEIYNHKYVNSDGENLIPLYKKYGYDFPKHLDGEWAIALYDFDKGIVLFSTDPFATKPFWINGTECASYQSGVGGYKMVPNTIHVKKLGDGSPVYSGEVYHFDFDNQHKDTYDDWIKAFKLAIKKRARDNCFIGLSSGYDSGGIACELHKQKVPFIAYSIPNNEDLRILFKREEILDDVMFIKTKERFEQVKEFLKKNMELFKYTIEYNGIVKDSTIHDDPAHVGLGMVCEQANKNNRKVYLSGQGADEIMSDYMPYLPAQSSLKGEFPFKLERWYNFQNGCQESYIAKEEYVAGAYNIETRYPYLDKDVVQEFLWLKQGLKNRMYKAPLTEYLNRNSFPYERNKRGFCPI
jgi:asparagine synthetase B (glutamine-hydrolysing)